MPFWKTLLLSIYYYGSCPYRWRANRLAMAEGRMPVVVLFYHRIADAGANSWTTSNRAFARQIAWLESHFELVSLETAQRRMRLCHNSHPCVSITFDDGYADNCHQAIPLLIKKSIPCTYFVTVENVLRGKPFAHDLAQGNRLAPNTVEQLRAMAAAGVEIGSHCYHHIDLGQVVGRKQLHEEVVCAGRELQAAIGQPVRYLAFPFGQLENLNPEVFLLAREAGYRAVCSAYGGYNFPGDDPFHLERIHVDNMIRLKNRATIDPRKLHTMRFQYDPAVCESALEKDSPQVICR